MPENKKLVYVVEDDEEQLSLLRIFLNSAGYSVVTETNADNVIEGVKRLSPHVVLMDVMLPSCTGTDGFQLCHDIKSSQSTKDVRVIIVSAIAQGVGSNRNKIMKQTGADDYFLKPYDPSELLKRIAELAN